MYVHSYIAARYLHGRKIRSDVKHQCCHLQETVQPATNAQSRRQAVLAGFAASLIGISVFPGELLLQVLWVCLIILP